ncbi:MAG: YgiQ family radical SAM protein [Calditrichaeota bacterium]|nr:YgiQ family radical SAM protein [Calditrichota bacterium]
MFLPTTREEMDKLGWDKLDVILVSGDTYFDSSYIGVAVIGRVLTDAGFRVGIIAQPEVDSYEDITRLGEPEIFWGVSAGSVDSMVANYTATKKRRKNDDFTPGAVNNRRPDRATIVYTNLVRRNFKNTKPIVLGGIEASLRRIAHYDYWSNKIRKSILFDSKADYLLYGMAEAPVLQLANGLRDGGEVKNIRGLCYISVQPPKDYIELQTFDLVSKDQDAFIKMFRTFYYNTDLIKGKGLYQKYDNRYLIQNPPTELPSEKELDHIYELGFKNSVHPYYKSQGEVRALDTIQFSVTTHRGCYGECNFCAITMHQGRTISSRSEKSVISEVEGFIDHQDFRGIVRDVGGPTANMYGFECDIKLSKGCCDKKMCIFPNVCKQLKVNHSPQTKLLKKLRNIDGIKRVFVASGIRYDAVMADKNNGDDYIKELVGHHVSGQMKLAPEHSEKKVLNLMGKPGTESLLKFKKKFDGISKSIGKKQFLTYYLIAAHPGCGISEMQSLKDFTSKELKLTPEQVQVFIPLPSTWSSVMYYTGKNPFTGNDIFVEKDMSAKEKQKKLITGKVRARRDMPKPRKR